jgi:hypothetical protein
MKTQICKFSDFHLFFSLTCRDWKPSKSVFFQKKKLISFFGEISPVKKNVASKVDEVAIIEKKFSSLLTLQIPMSFHFRIF